MNLKQELDAQWNSQGVRNINHLNRWHDTLDPKTRVDFNIDATMIGRLFATRGRKCNLKKKNSKYRGATQPWLTPEALQRYRAHRAYVENHGHGIHGSVWI